MCIPGAPKRIARERRPISRQTGVLPVARGGSSPLRMLGIMAAYILGGTRDTCSAVTTARARLSRGALRLVVSGFVDTLSMS